MDRTIDAQPFLGQLAADPTARGLFSALTCWPWEWNAARPTLPRCSPRWRRSASALEAAAAGHPEPLSWENLLGRRRSPRQAGQYRFVLAQPRLDYGALEPGGAATARDPRGRRQPALGEGRARRSVRITGSVALSDEEFASVAAGRGRGHRRQRPAGDAVAGAGGAHLAADRADPARRSGSG